MTLSAGSELGSYVVTSLLGKGGMGEVYRARDAKLGREVAIKVLPEELASDPERSSRLEREARVLASLNHPNVATLYGAERDRGTHFLVMELIEGETLGDRIARGAIPVRDAIKLFVQVADGLEAAHEIGVVHRDLKPANIKLIGSSGSRATVGAAMRVKVLDFGLAKTTGSKAAGAGAQESSTMTAGPTAPGMFLGTPGYMSPQQVQGMPADKRSDIWAYGVCLYEALTASRPFAGANASAVLAEVLKEDPDLDRVDPRLRPIVERCLQKDPARRYRDIGDVRLDLEAAGERPEVEAPPRRRGAREKVAWLVALAAAAVAAWVLWTRPVPSSEPSTVGATRLSIATPDLIPEESFSGLAVSPDGRTVVYLGEVGGRHCLMRRDLDALESAPIAGTEGSWGFQFFSPDGKWLAHMSRDYVLQKLPIEGGRPVDLAHGQLWGGGDWGANGTIVIGNTSDGRIARLSEAGGELVPFTTLAEGEALHGHPWLLPGGEAILFTAQREGSPLIAAQRLDESGHRSLFEGEHPVLLPNGHLVFTRGNGLWAVRFDADRLEPVGEPVPLLDEPFTPRGFTTFAGSRSGTLVYTPRSAGVRGPLVWLDRTGREASVGLPPGDFMHPRVSPDGRRIAFVSVDGDEGYGRRGRSDVLILDGNSAQPRVVLSNNVANESPVWTPDGRGLVFRGRSLTEESLWFYDESRIRDLGTHSYDTVTPSDWAPGGLVLTSFARSETHGDLFTVSSETGEKKELLAKVSDEDLPVLSPDRRWLAYQDQTGAEEQILIRPFPSVESGGPWRITEGSFPAWNQDGSELFFIRDEAIWSVAMSAEPPFVKGDPILLVRGPYFDDPFFSRPYDYDPHTDRFLVVRREVSRRSLVVVQNLDQELERRFAAQ